MKKFPSKKEIREFIERAQQESGEVSRREIARAFGIKGEARTELRRVLRELNDEGAIIKKGKRARASGTLPAVIVADVVAIDDEGDLICAPSNWREETAPPTIIMPLRAAQKLKPAPGRGDRILARVTPEKDGSYRSSPIKQIGKGQERLLGVYRKTARGGSVEAVTTKQRRDYHIDDGDQLNAVNGDLVWIELLNARGYGPKRARVREVVANVSDPSSYSLIAIANHAIRTEFPPEVLDEAEGMSLPDERGRVDLRDTPLITIDPADARDHDDAVYAAPDTNPKNPGGWRIIVAIADVSWFVTPGSALDREALKRGNSTYLPDMVVPMLPERLSNDLCSLREGEDRPALAVEMVFNAQGVKRSHKFMRIAMRSHARVSYTELQNAVDGDPNERTAPLLDAVIMPLWKAYTALKTARDRRNPLELELPERKIRFGEDGRIAAIETKERFEANKLIEEMMIQANIAAAETLEESKFPRIYRVHGEPDEDKFEDVRRFLDGMGYSLPKGQVLKPANLNQVLRTAQERDEIQLVSQVLLRAQRQAIYDSKNIGHFGLNLTRYAHFTSPIRRYADLTVHRALVAGRNLGKGAQSEEEAARLDRIAEKISGLERQSMAAERESTDRFLADWMKDRIGTQFSARINGVVNAGIFVTLKESGADGFIPARTLGSEYFHFDEFENALISERTGKGFRLGQSVDVSLQEVSPLQGGLLFEMLSAPEELSGYKRANRNAKLKGPKSRSRSRQGGKKRSK